MGDRPDPRGELRELRERLQKLEARLAASEAASGQPELVTLAAGDPGNLDNVFFRQLFENSPEAIVLLDTEDRVFDANRSFERIFGYRLAEAQGRTINSLIVPEDMEEQASSLSAQVLGGEVVARETVRCRSDGSRVDVTILGYPIFLRGEQIGLFGIYSDISVRRRFERQLRLQSAAMDSAVNAIFITDCEGRIVWANRAFARATGYSQREIVGRCSEILDPRDLETGQALDKNRWLDLRPREVWRARLVCTVKDGRSYPIEQTVTPFRDPRSESSHFVVVQEDISDRVEAQEQLERMARHDFLTDLPNRYSFHERLKVELDHSRHAGDALAVIVLDLDHFKDVNDTYGHNAGDDLLVAVSQRLRATLRESSILARLGGDEFAIVQTEIHDPENARGLAVRLLEAFREPFALRGHKIHASASLGISVFPPGEADPRSLVKKADMAMYRAKAEGRGTFRFYEEEMDREVRQRMRLGQDLHGAVERGELFLEYQPQVALEDRRVVGVEALLRWRHPEFGIVRPDVFIPIAEGSGLIVPIGAWVLETACRAARRWEERFGVAVPVAVNVSSVQFREPHFADTVEDVLRGSGLEPDMLQLELTEGTLMQATRHVEGALSRLGSLGVQLSLDDFGKGYSSLEYLRRLPLELLKIDRSFVQGLGNGSHDPVIVSIVMTLGRQLDLRVIAEGIETDEQLEFLEREGCPCVQGFLFSRPLSEDRLSELLETGTDRIAPIAGPHLRLASSGPPT